MRRRLVLVISLTICGQACAQCYVRRVSATEVHFLCPARYYRSVPLLPLWQAYIFRSGVGLMSANAWTLTGHYCTSFVRTDRDTDVTRVYGRDNWTLATPSRWTDATLGSDDGETSGGPEPFTIPSNEFKRTSAQDESAWIDVIVPDGWDGASIDMSWYYAAEIATGWQIDCTRRENGSPPDSAIACALNGRGIWNAVGNVFDGRHRCVRMWNAAGQFLTSPVMTQAPSVELLRNLSPGTYRIQLTKLSGSSNVMGVGRVRVRRHFNSGVLPGADHVAEYFCELQRSVDERPGPFGQEEASSITFAMGDGSTFSGGTAHGGEVQSSITWEADGGGGFASLGDPATGGTALGDLPDGGFAGPFAGLRLSIAGALSPHNADYTEAYELRGDQLRCRMTFDFVRSLYLDVHYIGMALQNTSGYRPLAADGLTQPYDPSHIEFVGALGAEYPLDGTSHSGFFTPTRAIKYNRLEGAEQRNVGRWFLINFDWQNPVHMTGGNYIYTHLRTWVAPTRKSYATQAYSYFVRSGTHWLSGFDMAYTEAARAPGDLDGDGVVNWRDVAPFVYTLLGEPFRDDAPAICDMNGDGEADADDIPLFVQTLLAEQ